MTTAVRTPANRGEDHGPAFRGCSAGRRSATKRRGRDTISTARTHIILILEDLSATRDWLRAIAAEAYPQASVTTAASLAEARRWLAGQHDDQPLLALVDLGLPDGSGIDFIRELLARMPSARPVVTTLFDDDDHLMAAMAAGAKGYLLKDHEPADIVRRLHAMEHGESPISPAMAERILAHFRAHARFVGARSDETQLTVRETDVLRLIGRGLKISEAAAALGIGEGTVSGYLKTVYRKLDINTRAEAAVEAVRRGLV